MRGFRSLFFCLGGGEGEAGSVLREMPLRRRFHVSLLTLRFRLCCIIPSMNLAVLSVVFESTKASEIYVGLG